MYTLLQCIQRECDKCGVENITECLGNLTSCTKQTTPLKWKKWIRHTKIDDGKKTSKMALDTKDGTLEELISELQEEATTISQHLFTAAWQSNQFTTLTSAPPAGWVIMVLDFAENYACRYQDEIQSVHWGHDSATLRPIVAYYQCPKCQQPTTVSMIMITEDNNHDHHAVHSFTDVAVEYLKTKLAPGYIKKVVRFSDGCQNQYKSRNPFMDFSFGSSDYDVEFQHKFFGSRHGKGPSDGESGVIKRQASDAVMSGSAVIGTASDLYKFVRNNATHPDDPDKCQHFQRSAFWISDISRNRNRQVTKTVAGTRQFHSVLSVRPKVIAVRRLSCFCHACIEEKGAKCCNSSYVQRYVHTSLEAGVKAKQPAQESSEVSLVVEPLAEVSHTMSSAKGSSSADSLVVTVDERVYKVGEYVAVIFDDAWWAGEVTNVSDEMCLVNFLTRKGENHFAWPSQKDDAWIQKKGIFKQLPSPPTPVTSRYLGFDPGVFKDVTSAVSRYLQENEH
ncbi:uncharacterized protein LOC117299279 [Asterias rubens]|uniref:uncharacterized protein LOC117299279 n=1 Tax=Asterias rubens TaxID=7604 RepID=UPI0014555C5A|nr:uncharacterized protein LOC117299279 [Asterias rubens]